MKGQEVIANWFEQKEWRQFPFQKEMEKAFLSGYSGLLNAPTGSGKTFALFLPFIADYINKIHFITQRHKSMCKASWN